MHWCRLRCRLSCQLTVCALLLCFVPLAAHAQSLGEVARQLREERQQSDVKPGKVYTNEDLETPAEEAEQAKAEEQTPQERAAEAKKATGAEATNGEAKGEKKKTLEEEMQEHDTEQRQKYGKLIGDLQEEIAKTEQELQKLQHDQMISTNQFRSSNGTSPNVYEYDDQQRTFNEQINAAKQKLEELQTKLGDAKEEARHAGVRDLSE